MAAVTIIVKQAEINQLAISMYETVTQTANIKLSAVNKTKIIIINTNDRQIE